MLIKALHLRHQISVLCIEGRQVGEISPHMRDPGIGSYTEYVDYAHYGIGCSDKMRIIEIVSRTL
jgi:hypothetical protein